MSGVHTLPNSVTLPGGSRTVSTSTHLQDPCRPVSQDHYPCQVLYLSLPVKTSMTAPTRRAWSTGTSRFALLTRPTLSSGTVHNFLHFPCKHILYFKYIHNQFLSTLLDRFPIYTNIVSYVQISFSKSSTAFLTVQSDPRSHDPP